ncbi:2-oxo acid dehydrogenase subunit E2 [Sphaerisporangium flaviroseum]|uniref:Dihydrolipoamide acetyltransferase component of pyruvate dehydrogenase complex n=1 Tax=Sphaerisporangium flaviroseum TaxID=509199 RepID=A0ABP7HUL4_9ACTN
MIDIRVPKLNTNDAQYVLVEWVAEDGSPVRAGDPLAVVETSKTAEEIVSEGEGLLSRNLPEGADCEPGQVIARLFDTDQERRVFTEAGREPAAFTEGEPVTTEARQEPAAFTEGEPVTTEAGREPATFTEGEPVITAPARALMDRLGITTERIRALDKKIIRRSDIEELLSTAPPPSERADEARGGRIVTLSRAQQRAASVVELSYRTIPAAFTVMKVDVGAALSAGRALTRSLRTLVGLPELLVKAVGSLHERFPLFFASPIDARTVRVAGAAHVGVTFDVGKGLVIPVLTDASARSLADISRALMAFRLTAMRGEFRERDLRGAGIVVTLHNEPGVLLAVPIIFPGHVCALSLAAPYQEVVPDGGGGFEVRDVVQLGVAFDHRVVNGRDAVQFLDALRTALASPETLAAPGNATSAEGPASPRSLASPEAEGGATA